MGGGLGPPGGEGLILRGGGRGWSFCFWPPLEAKIFQFFNNKIKLLGEGGALFWTAGGGVFPPRPPSPLPTYECKHEGLGDCLLVSLSLTKLHQEVSP